MAGKSPQEGTQLFFKNFSTRSQVNLSNVTPLRISVQMEAECLSIDNERTGTRALASRS
jgi:hypothetical protein